MSHPYLDRPIRTEQQARADIERNRRLTDHGVDFNCQILGGAFERVYGPDGSYVLVDTQGRVFNPMTFERIA